MERLTPTQFGAAAPALAALDHNLAVRAVLAGRVPGEVWVDNAARPSLAVVRSKLRGFIGGGAGPGEAAAVAALLRDTVLPEAQAAGLPGLMAHATDAAWAAGLDEALGELLPDSGARQYYEYAVTPDEAGAALPDGFALRAVDADLLADPHLTGLDELREEMCSERESVAAFLAESFGVCAVQGDALAGWCLSEYNLGDRCEVGIATAPPYQRRGLATAMTRSFLAQAAAHGVRRVGWHCWTRNLGSAATARKAGFSLRADETVRLVWWGA